MKQYTVICLDDTTGIVINSVHEAVDEYAAMATVGKDITDKDDGSGRDIQVICAIEGDHVVYPPCEDSGKACYAADLAGGAE